MSERWKFDTERVETGQNSIEVRELTDAERARFAAYCADKANDKLGMLSLLVSIGGVDPKLTQAEACDMPAKLLDKAAQTILRLSGISTSDDDPAKKND